MKKLLSIFLFLSIGLLTIAQSVNVRGVVRPSGSPTTFVNPSSLPNFTNVTGTASASSQPIAVAGSGLTADITATAPSGFEVSLNNSSFSPSVILTRSGGSVNANIWARVAAATAAGSYGPSNITFTSSGSNSPTCSVTATVSASGSPTVNASPTTISGFATTVGTQSNAQSSVISGSNLTNNITVTAPASYLASTDNTNFFSSVVLTQSGGSVPNTTVYFVISAAASIGSPGGNATVVSSPATQVNIALSGTVSSNTAIDSVVAQFFFRRTSTTVAGWTCVNGDPTAGVVNATDTRNFRNVGISSVAGHWLPLSGSSALDAGGGGNNTHFPTSVTTGLWYHATNGPAGGNFFGYVLGDTSLVMTNLDPTKLYTFEVFCSQAGGAIGCPSANASIYFVDSTNNRVDSAVINTKDNTVSIFKINKKPDAFGRIKLGVYPQANGSNDNCSQYGIINGVIVTKQVTRNGFDDLIGMLLLLGLSIGLIRRKKNYLIDV